MLNSDILSKSMICWKLWRLLFLHFLYGNYIILSRKVK